VAVFPRGWGGVSAHSSPPNAEFKIDGLQSLHTSSLRINHLAHEAEIAQTAVGSEFESCGDKILLSTSSRPFFGPHNLRVPGALSLTVGVRVSAP
jgi:hypothetical protein